MGLGSVGAGAAARRICGFSCLAVCPSAAVFQRMGGRPKSEAEAIGPSGCRTNAPGRYPGAIKATGGGSDKSKANSTFHISAGCGIVLIPLFE